MMKPLAFLAPLLSLAVLAGCGGSKSAPASSTIPTTRNFGSLTMRAVGEAQAPVTFSAANGANVTGIAGAEVDQLTLNPTMTKSLRNTKIAYSSLRDGFEEIYTMDADGTNETRLTHDAATNYAPSWYPDATRIAFVGLRDGGYNIYTMNADGTNKTRLTDDTASKWCPSWSPDGTKIAFHCFRKGNFDIYSMNADGTNETRLTSDSGDDYEPTWSPDGTKIAFYSRRRGNYDIYSMNADGTNQTRLTSSATDEFGPRWSPDGTRIAFTMERQDNKGADIYSMDADGTNETRLTSDSGDDYGPTWSPDGTRIAFVSARDSNDGSREIYSMSASGGDETRLTFTKLGENGPSWSGYLPRTARTLIGTGGTLRTAAAGFLFGQNDTEVTSVVAFDTTAQTPAARAQARVFQAAPETQGHSPVFAISTSGGLGSVSYMPIGAGGVPGAVVSPAIPIDSTNALVSFNATLETVTCVIPYESHSLMSAKPIRSGNHVTYTEHFTAIYDEKGQNLAPAGARSVTMDETTGKLVRFE